MQTKKGNNQLYINTFKIVKNETPTKKQQHSQKNKNSMGKKKPSPSTHPSEQQHEPIWWNSYEISIHKTNILPCQLKIDISAHYNWLGFITTKNNTEQIQIVVTLDDTICLLPMIKDQLAKYSQFFKKEPTITKPIHNI